MLFGNYQIGNAKKFDSHSIFDDIGSIDGFVAQFVNLDEAQQKAFLSLSTFDEGLEKYISDTKNAVQTGEKFNSQLFEQIASEKDDITTGVLDEFMKAGGLKDANGVLSLPNTQDAIALMEDYANHCSDASKIQQLFNAGILEQEDGVYKLSQAFLKEISVKQTSTVATVALTAAQKAWNIVAQYGKQLLLSLGVAAVAFIATKIVDYLMNLKTRSEELVATMNDSHDKAQQATKDVEEIQSKIDELNKSLKDAGVKQISDIVDPAERERLQTINDMLQAQLELKKQLEKDATNKANTDTSAAVNDITEDSIVKSHTVNVSYAEGGANAGTHQVAEKVTKTESLNEHSDYLDQLVQKRREMAAAGEEETQAYKDNEAEIEKEKKKVGELSTAVSEQADKYETDADNFDQYKDEYVGCTDAIKAAAAAIKNANDGLDVDTTNLDIFAEKVRKIKNDIDNGDSQQSDWKMFNGLGAFSGMTGESIIDIDKDTTNQTDAEKTALEKLHQVADDNNISFENLIGVFEQFGIIQTGNASAADNYAEQLEKTMGVIDDIQSAYKNCSTAVEEYNKYGYLSVDSLQSLLQMDDKYLNTLELVNGKLQLNQGAYADLLAAQYAEAQMEAISQAISELNAIATGDAAEKTDTYTEATEDEKKKLEALCPALKDATIGTGELAGALAGAQAAANGDNADEIEGKISSVMTALNTRLSLISTNMNNAMNSASGLKNQLNGFSDSTNNSSKAAQTFLDAWSTVTSAMKEFNEQGYLTMQTVQSLTGLEDKYSSVLQKNDTTGKLEIQTAKFKELMEAELKDAKIKGDNASVSQYNKILEWTTRNVDTQTMSYWDLVAAIEGYSAALSEAKEITDGFKDAWDNGKTVKEKSEKSRTGALDYEGTEAQSAALQSIKKYSQYDPDLINKAYNKDTGKIDLSGDVLKDAVVESLKQQAEAARTEGGAASEAIARSYEIAKENIENDVISVQDYFDGLGSTVEEFNSKIDDMQSAWTDLSDVTNEYNTYGGLSVDSIQKLLTMSPEYLQFLKMQGGQLVFNKEAMLAKTKADILAKAAELELKQETKDQAEILRALADSLDKGADSMEGMGKSAEKLKTLMSELNTVLNSFIGVFDDLNDKQSNDLKIQGEAWIDVIDKRIDALNEENDAQERAIELAKLQDEYERAKANKTVHVYGGKGQGFVWKADENAVREAGQNLSDKQREYKKQDEIDKLEKLKDKVQEANNLIGTSWDDYQKKLKYTAEFEAMTFEQMEGHYDGFKGSVLNNMQAIQGATNVKNVITDISNLISTLETLANILNLLNGGTGDGGGVFGFINQIKNMFTGENGDFDLGGGFKKMFDGAAKVVSDGWNWITGKNRAGSAALKSDTTATLDILGNTIQVNTGSIQRISGGFFERLVGAAKDNLGSIGKFFSGA